MAGCDYGSYLGVPGVAYTTNPGPYWQVSNAPQWSAVEITTASDTNDLTITGTLPYPDVYSDAEAHRWGPLGPPDEAWQRNAIAQLELEEALVPKREDNRRPCKPHGWDGCDCDVGWFSRSGVTAFFALTVEEAVVIWLMAAWIVVRWWVV